MKSLVLTSFLLSLFVHIQAQSPSWQWAYSASGNVQAVGNFIKTDPSGNVYVLGAFNDSMIIVQGDTILNTDTFSYTGNFFLIKYTSSGTIAWSKAIGAPRNEVINPVMTTDAFGNVIVGGNFSGAVLVLGSDTIHNLAPSGFYPPFFMVEYTSSGTMDWWDIGDTGITLAAIAADAAGNIDITGKLSDTSAIFGNDTLVNAGNYTNAMVGMYDSSGDELWASRFGGTEYDQAQAISVDAAGNSYILGTYSSPVITSGSVTITDSAGRTYLFVAKYDAAGSIAWAQGIKGGASDLNPAPVNAITNDASGNVYITGTVSGDDSLNFGGITLVNPDTVGYGDLFIAKYTTAGNAVWAKSPQCNDQAEGYALTTGINGNIYLAGSFSGHTIIFGNDTAFNPNMVANQPEAILLAELDTAGNGLWATAVGGGTEGDYANAIATDAGGDVYVTGYFYSSYIVFGSDTLQGTTADESSSVFVAKYGPNASGIAATAASVGTIIVYPNPSTGQFWFKGITPGSTVEVYNMLGQVVYSAITTNDNYLMNISGNAKGIYLYHVIDKGSNVQQGKIVVE